jgi:hypothetical protein
MTKIRTSMKINQEIKFELEATLPKGTKTVTLDSYFSDSYEEHLIKFYDKKGIVVEQDCFFKVIKKQHKNERRSEAFKLECSQTIIDYMLDSKRLFS